MINVSVIAVLSLSMLILISFENAIIPFVIFNNNKYNFIKTIMFQVYFLRFLSTLTVSRQLFKALNIRYKYKITVDLVEIH